MTSKRSQNEDKNLRLPEKKRRIQNEPCESETPGLKVAKHHTFHDSIIEARGQTARLFAQNDDSKKHELQRQSTSSVTTSDVFPLISGNVKNDADNSDDYSHETDSIEDQRTAKSTSSTTSYYTSSAGSSIQYKKVIDKLSKKLKARSVRSSHSISFAGTTNKKDFSEKNVQDKKKISTRPYKFKYTSSDSSVVQHENANKQLRGESTSTLVESHYHSSDIESVHIVSSYLVNPSGVSSTVPQDNVWEKYANMTVESCLSSKCWFQAYESKQTNQLTASVPNLASSDYGLTTQEEAELQATKPIVIPYWTTTSCSSVQDEELKNRRVASSHIASNVSLIQQERTKVEPCESETPRMKATKFHTFHDSILEGRAQTARLFNQHDYKKKKQEKLQRQPTSSNTTGDVLPLNSDLCSMIEDMKSGDDDNDDGGKTGSKKKQVTSHHTSLHSLKSVKSSVIARYSEGDILKKYAADQEQTTESKKSSHQKSLQLTADTTIKKHERTGSNLLKRKNTDSFKKSYVSLRMDSVSEKDTFSRPKSKNYTGTDLFQLSLQKALAHKPVRSALNETFKSKEGITSSIRTKRTMKCFDYDYSSLSLEPFAKKARVHPTTKSATDVKVIKSKEYSAHVSKYSCSPDLQIKSKTFSRIKHETPLQSSMHLSKTMKTYRKPILDDVKTRNVPILSDKLPKKLQSSSHRDELLFQPEAVLTLSDDTDHITIKKPKLTVCKSKISDDLDKDEQNAGDSNIKNLQFDLNAVKKIMKDDRFGAPVAGTSKINQTKPKHKAVKRTHQTTTKQKTPLNISSRHDMKKLTRDTILESKHVRTEDLSAQHNEQFVNFMDKRGPARCGFRHYEEKHEPITLNRVVRITANTLVDYRDVNHTSYFRDQKRHIDMVLVVDNTEDMAVENIKQTFLFNCIGAGFELELEANIQSKNSGYIFIKVHAPDSLLIALGKHYGTRKYFWNNHLELSGKSPERNIIKAVRRHYPGPEGWSPMDRITAVFRLLRVMPFGIARNYLGIERLLQQGIIRDCYPLHEGPYFTVDKSVKSVNARQVLYTNWVGYENILKPQPVHILREYLGERIAFLFAFYEFYNLCLIPTWLAAYLYYRYTLLSTTNDFITKSACTNQSYRFPHWFTETVWLTYRYTYTQAFDKWMLSRYWPKWNLTMLCRDPWWKRHDGRACPYNYQLSRVVNTYQHHSGWVGWLWDHLIPKVYYWAYTWTSTFSKVHWKIGLRSNYKTAIYEDMPICPKCKNFRACPFKNMTDYCTEVKFKNYLDSPYSVYAAAFMVVWGILFYLFWRRRENYYYWLWETSERETERLFRPDYIPKIKKTKIVMFFLIKLVIISGGLILYTLFVIPVLLTFYEKSQISIIYYYKSMKALLIGSYCNLGVMSALNGFLIIAFEACCTKLSFVFNRLFHSARSEKEYELSLAIMLFGFFFIVNNGLVAYFTFVKGAMYTYPSDPQRWYLPMGIGISNCGMLGCIDEVFITLIVSWISRKSFVEFDQMFRKTHSTDYNTTKWHNRYVPSWEKQFDLMPLTEAEIMKKWNFIMLQMCFVTFNFWLIPFAGFILFLINLFEIRYWSKTIIITSRRPLPMKTWGTGSYRHILAFLPYMCALWSIGSIVRLSNVVPRTMHQRYFPATRYFVDFTMGVFNTSDFYNVTMYQTGNNTFTKGSPSEAWNQYQLGYYDRRLYPHWAQADFCLFPNMYNRRMASHKLMRVYENSYMPNLNYWNAVWHKVLIVIVFEQLTVLLSFILSMTIGSISEMVRNTRDVEAMIKTSKQKKS